jgi:hypothetical protein
MYNLKHKSENWLLAAFVTLGVNVVPTSAYAQTLVPPTPASGTWTLAGNPYVIVDNVSVPSGQTLTIQPGVVVVIGSALSITANGVIQAVGSPSQRITFQAPISSQFWTTISLNGTGDTNRFKYCDFRNANTALVLGNGTVDEVMYSSFLNMTNGITIGAYGGNQTMTPLIFNCAFSNCVSQAIYGEAIGPSGSSTTLSPMIENCVFSSSGYGCVFHISGQNGWYGPGYGYAGPRIIANVFQNLNGTAFRMSVGSYAGGGQPAFINNTVVNCGAGTDASDPWDARIQDNIFVGCTNAVNVNGALSRSASYNNFFGGATNFTGYPTTYGQAIWINRNAIPSDLLFNIFQDPKFVSASDFHLQSDSTCIDAGTPDWAYSDMCFTNSISQGNSYPDLGAYGGPDAANWLDTVPKMPVHAFITQTNDAIWINWGALPRSSYQVQCLTNLSTPGTNAWTDLAGGLMLATGKPAFLRVGTSTATNGMLFRVQSLGRNEGD